MKNIKKTVSVLLTFVIILSTVIIGFNIFAQAQANYIVNGDFEKGKMGYLYADDVNTTIEVYNNADTTRPGYGEVTLDGKAAYILGNGGNIAYAKKNNLQYKIDNLPAGEYTVTMDVLLNNLNKSAWATLAFGVTGSFDTTNGRAYSKPMITDSHAVTENGTAVTTATASNNTYHRIPGSSLSLGWHDLDVSMSFTITETTTVYLFVFCDGAPASGIMNATAYVDNIVLAGSESETIIVNGDFSDGLTGYEYSTNTTNTSLISVTDNGVCYIPERTNDPYNRFINQKVSLANGTYTFSFDLDITYTTGTQYEFAYAVRLEDGLDGYVRPATSKTSTYCTLGEPKLSALENVLNTSDETSVTSLTETSFRYSSGQDYYYHKGASGKRYVGKVTVEIIVNNPNSDKTNFYFSIGCPAKGVFAYIDNISINESTVNEGSPVIDISDSIILTMDNDDFSKLNISSANQDVNNDMKIEIVDSGDSKYGNVLKLPEYTGSITNDKIRSARFFTKYKGLTVGKTYSVNFDMKMPSFIKGSATQWLGLVGVSHKMPVIMNAVTIPSSTMLPAKITTYTDKGTNTPISVGTFTNWSSCVFQWNNLGSAEWINYTIDFVAEDTVAYFFIENYLSGISDFYVDNISVTSSDSQLDGKIKLDPQGDDKIIPEANSKNVLIIGNSFASHTLSAPLLNVINADEALLNIARYGKGAMSPGYFANQIINDRVNMEFSYAGKGNNSIYTCKGNISRDSVKNFADWDYIIVQAFTVGQSNTQNWSEVASLVNAVNTYLANANTKVLVWIPQSVSQSYCDANFNGADASIYKNYHDALATDLENSISNGTVNADGIFNVNEMFWIARNYLGPEGLHVDGLHINSTGAYLMGLAIHKLVCGTDPTDFNIQINSNNVIDKALKEAVNGVESSINSASIENGDFEEGKKGYMYADSSSKIKIYDDNDTNRPGYGKVALDGKAAYILGGGDSAPTNERKNYPLQYMLYNLPAGEYTISMNVLLNMIDTSSWAPLAFGITDGLNAKGYAYGVRLINSTGEGGKVQFTDYMVKVKENGTEVAVNPSHVYHRIAGSALSKGWHNLDVSISFKTTEKKTLYFFLHCSGDGSEEGIKATAYVDNVTFSEGGYVDTNFTFDFESGGTDGILYRETDPAYSHRYGLERTDEEAKQGKYSLVSTAISDEATSGTKVRGSFALPITDLEKNKNYELSFWFKFKGNDETLKSGFRVSKETAAPEENSLVSTAAQVNFSSDIKFSDASHKAYMYGWAGFIALSNSKKGKDWVNVSIKFNTGENSTVYLQFVNFAKKDTTFYIDDIKYAKFDGELPVQPIAQYDYENMIYNISFEENVSNPLRIDGTPCKHYTKSSKYAHSGKYSVVWDAYHDDGWENLAFTDKVGNAAYNPVLEPNTVYKYSCWIYAVGSGASDVKVAWNSPAQQKQTSQKMPDAAKEWQQFVYTFSTGPEMTSCPIEFAVGISGLQYEGLKVYVDDIKLEKLVCSILAIDTEENYCEDIVNLIDNGNFEEKIDGSIWDTGKVNIKLVKETETSLAPSGAYYAHISGNTSLKVKIKLKPGYEYKFMYSYKANKKSDFKIGILDDNEKELQPAYGSDVKQTGLLTPKADGMWHREGYTLFSSASGYVYFCVSGTNSDIYLDAVSLYKSRLDYELDPNTYDNDITLTSLQETEDITADFDADNSLILEDPEDDTTDEETPVSGGRYKKIKRIYTTNWWVYALIIAGGVIAAGGIAVLTIVLVKKKRRKNG